MYIVTSTYSYQKNEVGFQGDIAYFILNTIVAANGSSQSNNEAFMAEMYLTLFSQYLVSALQELITMPNSAYLDKKNPPSPYISTKMFPKIHEIKLATS